jgi:class 3 adenylate cyclase
VVFGESEDAPMSALFAASYPERVTALVLYGPLVKAVGDDDFPWAVPKAMFDSLVATAAEHWGDASNMRLFAPSRPETEENIRWGSRFERYSLTPASFSELFRTIEKIDIRPVLPSVRVPTHVVHRSGDLVISVEQGRYLAEHIEGATFTELPGDDHYCGAGDVDALVDEIEEFVTGVRPAVEPDRVLATVMFTDIVGSTELASRLGDRGWGEVLARHDALVSDEVHRHGGRVLKHTGDGALAIFDGPARGVRCACAIRDGVKPLSLEIRAGLHTGEIELDDNDVRGIAVHIGARVEALAGASEVLVSRTVTDLVAGSGLAFEERGEHELKGVPGRWPVFAVR